VSCLSLWVSVFVLILKIKLGFQDYLHNEEQQQHRKNWVTMSLFMIQGLTTGKTEMGKKKDLQIWIWCHAWHFPSRRVGLPGLVCARWTQQNRWSVGSKLAFVKGSELSMMGLLACRWNHLAQCLKPPSVQGKSKLFVVTCIL